MATALQIRDAEQVIDRLERQNNRLRAALEACAADYISAPTTVIEGHSLLAAEFRRRMEIANAALER